MIATAVHAAWRWSCRPGARRYERALREPEAAQRAVLARILAAHAACRYARRHGVDGMTRLEDFRARMPLVAPDELRADFDAIARGTADVLFPGRPRSLEPTSGSGGGTKLIPVTPLLRAEFQAGIAPWIAGLARQQPAAFRGRSYWAISPALHVQTRTVGGLPVGFADDAAYLHPLLAGALRHALAVPSAVARLGDPVVFRRVSLAFLLAAGDLALVSVWNPSFFTLLLAAVDELGEAVVSDLQRGKLSLPSDTDAAVAHALQRAFRPGARRGAEVREILAETGPRDPARFRRLWPRLALLSCWADGAARADANELRGLFPGVRLQPKGLLATEGIVSIPLPGADGPALALTSHFLEFEAEDGPAAVRTAWELEKDRSYRVVLTTGGGLYRYRLGDVVRVTGFAHRCPLVEFIGRGDHVSDLRGEKLHEAHVGTVVRETLDACGVPDAFVLLAPDRAAPRYLLFFGGVLPDGVAAERVRDMVEEGLGRNVHYAHCRRLGQLRPVEWVRIGRGAAFARARYELTWRRRGVRAGAVKPLALDGRDDWREVFECPPE